MKAVKARITNALTHCSIIPTCDNSGAKLLKLTGVKTKKTVKGRYQSAGVGDLILAAVVNGKSDIRGQVVFAVIVRQKKEYRRPDGTRVAFEDNAAVVLKDDKGTPKGTLFKGPIAKEACERWPGIAKMANIIA